jgi:hypothetical protein
VTPTEPPKLQVCMVAGKATAGSGKPSTLLPITSLGKQSLGFVLSAERGVTNAEVLL